MASVPAIFDFDQPVVHFGKNPHLDAGVPTRLDGGLNNFFGKLPSGSQILPRFAILNECEFIDPRSGKKVVVDEERLRKLSNTLNQKFSKTGQAVPIIPGHTVDGRPEEEQPEIIGYGVDAEVEDQINPVNGEQVLDEKTGKPIKAIYLTPIALPGRSDTFRKLNRRSPELWLDPDDIDPLSLLGANTPRRNLGPHLFSRKGEEALINDNQAGEGLTTTEGALASPNKGPKTDLISATAAQETPNMAGIQDGMMGAAGGVAGAGAGAGAGSALGGGGPVSGDADPTAVKVFELIKQSDEWKEMEAVVSRLGQLAEVMEEQFGGQGAPGMEGAGGMGGPPVPGMEGAEGAGMPPGAGAAPGAGMPPGAGGGEPNPLFDQEPGGGGEEEEEPGKPEKMAAACAECGCSPCECVTGDDKSGKQKSEYSANPGKKSKEKMAAPCGMCGKVPCECPPGKKSKEKMMAVASGTASPAGPTNTEPPGYERGGKKGHATHHSQLSEQEKINMEAESNLLVRMARLERDFASSQRDNAAKDERIRLLETLNLQNEIDNELRMIADKGVLFDHDTERQTLLKFSKKEDREAHYTYMEKYFQKKQDQPPLNGRVPVPSRQQAPLQFARGLEQQAAGQARMTNDDAARIAEIAAKRIYEGGEKVTADQVWQEEQTKRNGTGEGMTQVR